MGKVVRFGRGRKSVDKVNLTFQLEDSILVNSVEDWILLCDIRFLSVPRSCLVSFSSWGFIIRIEINKLWLLEGGDRVGYIY